MRVSLAPAYPRARASDPSDAAPQPLLDPRGARILLGALSETGAPVAAISPAAHTLFGPRGACLAGRGGPLIICDTGHHRLLVWQRVPDMDNGPADLVIGQPDFRTEGRNAKGEIGPASLNVPTGIAVGPDVLAVADAWNHRVLLWHDLPRSSNQPADIVLGQADFRSGEANRGLAAARADTLNWCYGVAIHDGRLFVADAGNRRVLVWDEIPAVNGAPADLVLGQRDFTTRDESAGEGAGAVGMRWPHSIAAAGMLFVADAGNNRVMVWKTLPDRNGVPCDFVLGQAGFTGLDHNCAAYYPTASAMNMPYGLTVQSGYLVVADTANSRLLGFDTARLAMGAAATRLAGQSGFDDKGDNRWNVPSRDSLCWPYAVAARDNTLVVADSGNNRVLLWETA
ncbi:NHL repeat-containing protein [Rhodospirillaceae bacterium SYSU D60014]|uniref:NHL repeat-containing protein n=1 Tax=Virgifigura deserti TaxID=2268457 RepID=UPI000E670CEC